MYRYRPLPQRLLTRHCSDLKLSDVVTPAANSLVPVGPAPCAVPAGRHER
jgi:hypothetical protein